MSIPTNHTIAAQTMALRSALMAEARRLMLLEDDADPVIVEALAELALGCDRLLFKIRWAEQKTHPALAPGSAEWFQAREGERQEMTDGQTC